MALPPPGNGQYYTWEEYQQFKQSPDLAAQYNAYVMNRQAQAAYEQRKAEEEAAKGPGAMEIAAGALLPPAATYLGLQYGPDLFGPGTAEAIKETGALAGTANQVLGGGTSLSGAGQTLGQAGGQTAIQGGSTALGGGVPQSANIFGGSSSLSGSTPSLVQVGTNLNGTPMMAPSVAPAGAGSGLSVTGDIIPGAAAALGAYDLISNFGESNPMQGAMSGAGLVGGLSALFPTTAGTLGAGSLGALPFLGTPLAPLVIGGILGAGLGAVKNTGKPESQKSRDDVRKLYQQLGIVDKDYKINGYDIGKEDPLKNRGDADAFAGEHLYDLNVGNLTDTGKHFTTAGRALGLSYAPGADRTAAEQMANTLSIAAYRQGGDAMANLNAIAQRSGVPYETARQQLMSNPNISEQEKAGLAGALAEAYGVAKSGVDFNTSNLIKTGGAAQQQAPGQQPGVTGKLLMQGKQALSAPTMQIGNKPAPQPGVRNALNPMPQSRVAPSMGAPAPGEVVPGQSAPEQAPQAPQGKSPWERFRVNPPVGFNKVTAREKRLQNLFLKNQPDEETKKLVSALMRGQK